MAQSQTATRSDARAATETVAEEQLWSCRTCGACMQECPVFIEHIPTIVDFRRHLVMDQASIPATAAMSRRRRRARTYGPTRPRH